MKTKAKFKLSIVVPSYNEEQNVMVLAERLTDVIAALEVRDYQVIFVDDGSSDDTLRYAVRLWQLRNHREYPAA